MKSLKESLFDSDIVSKDLVDWERFKKMFVEKDPNERYFLFQALYSLLDNKLNQSDTRFILEIYWTDEQIQEYKKQQVAFDYILNSLRDAFKKQGGSSWVHINQSHLESIDSNMDLKELSHQNNELHKLMRNANKTAHESYFMVGNNKKIPESIMFMLDNANILNNASIKNVFKNAKNWAIDYYSDIFGEYGVYIFVCPKNIPNDIKKMLYE